MPDDAHLLRRYVDTRSEAAFAELVQRHIGLVYHAAARQLGTDKHLAEDVTQAVFVLLAEKSRSLLEHTSLAGWLHATTHFKVARALRTERRRRFREDAAFAMSELLRMSTTEEWERIRPLLDQVLLELNPSDREAVLLRFFENRPFAEIGSRLLLTEKTAHKRVERALEKLRERLERRGVKSTAAALVTLLGAHVTSAAVPAGLAATVTTSVVASGLPAAAAMGGLAFMSTKTTAVVATLAVVLVSGVATFQVNAQRDAEAAAERIGRENHELAERLRAAEERFAKLAAAPAPGVAPMAATVARPPTASAPTLPGVEEGWRFLKENPEVREALIVAQKARVREQYAEVLTALRLSEEEIERFLEIQINRTTRVVGEHLLNVAGEHISGRESAEQMRELLGEAGYERLQEFEALAPARGLADAMVRSLYATPAALTPEQKETFKQVVAQTLGDPSLGGRYTGAWLYLPPAHWEQVVKQAGTLLNEQQLAALRELQERSRFFHAQSAASRVWRDKEGGKQ